jgi:hypothetical protein
MYAGTRRGSFPFDSPPKSVSKGAQFWVFGVLGFEEFLAGFLRFLLIPRGVPLLTVNSCIKVRLDLQADKPSVVAKGTFFPQV